MLPILILAISILIVIFSAFNPKTDKTGFLPSKELSDYLKTEESLTPQQKLKSLLYVLIKTLEAEMHNYNEIRKYHDLYYAQYLPESIWEQIMQKKDQIKYEIMQIEGEAEAIAEGSYGRLKVDAFKVLKAYQKKIERDEEKIKVNDHYFSFLQGIDLKIYENNLRVWNENKVE